MPSSVPHINDPAAVMQLFDTLKTGILIIDHDFHVVMINHAASGITGVDPGKIHTGTTCFSLLFGRTSPCDDCPSLDAAGLDGKQKSYSLTDERGGNHFVKAWFLSWREFIVVTLYDVSQEVNLLRKVNLTRKELQAKNVLLERRRQKADKEHKLLLQLLDHLPEALVTVDSSFSIQTRNKEVENILNPSTSEKCYELVGRDDVCKDCPAVHGFARAAGMKKSHEIGGGYFTEIIAESPLSDGGILLFRDSTRQIHLINEIREQREAINRKNDILSGMVKIGARMQQEPDAGGVIDFFLDTFMPLIQVDRAAVFINDIREGNFWFSRERNLGKEDMNVLKKSYLSRDIQNFNAGLIPEESLPWEDTAQVVLMGGSGNRVGLILLPGHLEGETGELVKLFTEPLGAYVHNQLLMRKLEEKANTDPLTGLYNRGYLDQALQEEEKKRQEYQIPYAVVVADVNRLKKANDDYGHEAGDHLIMKVSSELKNSVRATDILVRTGGDEFLILLTNCDQKGADILLDRLTNKVFRGVFIEVGDNEKFPVTVSFGAAGVDVHPPESLIRVADRLMYESKEAYYKTEKRYR